jgi:hypothetical protein
MIRESKRFRQMMYFNGESYYILDFKSGDVNGDRLSEDVYLVGDKPSGEESPFSDNIALVIYDSKTNDYTKITPKDNVGYNPTIFLGDFTGDKVDDILISIDTGGSGGTTYNYIYSFLDNRSREIFDYEKFNDEFKYDVNYRDNYRVEVISQRMKEKYIVDISGRGKEYLSEIYNKNGRLKAPIEGFVNPISGVYPVDFQRDGIYELQIYQRVAGRYNADSLGFVQTNISWDGKKFVPVNQYLSIFGNNIGD